MPASLVPNLMAAILVPVLTTMWLTPLPGTFPEVVGAPVDLVDRFISALMGWIIKLIEKLDRLAAANAEGGIPRNFVQEAQDNREEDDMDTLWQPEHLSVFIQTPPDSRQQETSRAFFDPTTPIPLSDLQNVMLANGTSFMSDYPSVISTASAIDWYIKDSFPFGAEYLATDEPLPTIPNYVRDTCGDYGDASPTLQDGERTTTVRFVRVDGDVTSVRIASRWIKRQRVTVETSPLRKLMRDVKRFSKETRKALKKAGVKWPEPNRRLRKICVGRWNAKKH